MKYDYKKLSNQELINSVTQEQKENWNHGNVLPQYAHLNSAEKALPVIYALLDIWNAKQKEYKKNIAKEV